MEKIMLVQSQVPDNLFQSFCECFLSSCEQLGLHKEHVTCSQEVIDNIISQINTEKLNDIIQYILEENIDTIVCFGSQEIAKHMYTLSRFIRKQNSDIRIIHIPFACDNAFPDIPISLGYATTAKNMARFIFNENIDNSSFFKGVKINIFEEQDSWLTLASLCHESPKKNLAPILVFIPEQEQNFDFFLKSIKEHYKQYGYTTVVISESYLRNESPWKNIPLEEIQKEVSLQIQDFIKESPSRIPLNVQVWKHHHYSFPSLPSAMDDFLSKKMALESAKVLQESKDSGILSIHTPTQKLISFKTVLKNKIYSETRSLKNTFNQEKYIHKIKEIIYSQPKILF